MQISMTQDGESVRVAVAGQLNTATAGELEAAVDEAFESSSELVLDFAELDYLSSAGLRVLVAAHKRAVSAGGSVAIVNVVDDVREVFEITGLSSVLDIS